MAFEFWESEVEWITQKESSRLRQSWVDFIREAHWKWAHIAGPSKQMDLFLCYFNGKFDCPIRIRPKSEIRGSKHSLTAAQKLINQIKRKRRA